MRIEILVAVISLGGVVVGSGLTLLGNFIQNRQEKNAQIHKLITEKRVQAYEDILAITKYGALAVGVWENNQFIKYPGIFTDASQYDDWYANFALIAARSSHFIDQHLSYKIYLFNNYLVNLNNRLDNFRDDQKQFRDNRKAQLFGALLYEDFRKLTSDILNAATNFYASGIYTDKFVPAKLEDNTDLPPDFMQLALFSKLPEMREILMGE